MRIHFAFDTSALISLGHTGLYREILDVFDITVTDGILSELNHISRFEDKDSDIVRMVKDQLQYDCYPM